LFGKASVMASLPKAKPRHLVRHQWRQAETAGQHLRPPVRCDK
jgi:hypothetical protein